MSTKPFYIKKKGTRLRWQSQPRWHGRDPGRVDVERGNWRRQWQARKSFGASVPNEIHFCSFDWHHNLVSTHHVEPAACGRLDGTRIIAQLVDVTTQRVVIAAQGFNISLNSRVLLRSQI